MSSGEHDFWHLFEVIPVPITVKLVTPILFCILFHYFILFYHFILFPIKHYTILYFLKLPFIFVSFFPHILSFQVD